MAGLPRDDGIMPTDPALDSSPAHGAAATAAEEAAGVTLLNPGWGRLARAVGGLEAAFGRRRDRIGAVEACLHCFSAEQLIVLAGPVDEIPDALFSRALMKWGSTMESDVLLWRRWTPRILRQIAERRLHIDESWMARKFGEAKWWEWPVGEREAVAEFCEAWFATALTAESGPVAVDVLPFVAVLFRGLTHWLERWAATPGRRAEQQLAWMAGWWLPDLISGELDLSFSGDLPDVAAELSAWLVAQAPSRLRDGDLKPIDAYQLSQLPLPEGRRWRDVPESLRGGGA